MPWGDASRGGRSWQARNRVICKRCPEMIALVLALIWICIPEPAQASSRGQLYFLAIAQVSQDRGGGDASGTYRAFLQRIRPVWRRHGMTLLAHGPVIIGSGSDAASGSSSYVASGTVVSLLRIESRARFRAYLKDPDYERLRPLRLTAVDRLSIVEAFGSDQRFWADVSRSKRRSLELARFRTSSKAKMSCRADCFLLTDPTLFPVKGAVPAWMNGVNALTMKTHPDVRTNKAKQLGFATILLWNLHQQE